VGRDWSSRWRYGPAEYGPATTIYNRYNRWSQRGLWQRLFEQIAASGDVPHELSLDSSHVKAHRSAAGAKRMARPVGKWLLQSSVKFSIFRPIEGRPRHFEPPGI
jgi:transposase